MSHNPFQKQVKTVINESAVVFADKIVCKSNGSVEIMRGYFYRHGMDAEKWVDMVRVALKAANVAADVRGEDRFQPWPKDSYFVAVVTMKS